MLASVEQAAAPDGRPVVSSGECVACRVGRPQVSASVRRTQARNIWGSDMADAQACSGVATVEAQRVRQPFPTTSARPHSVSTPGLLLSAALVLAWCSGSTTAGDSAGSDDDGDDDHDAADPPGEPDADESPDMGDDDGSPDPEPDPELAWPDYACDRVTSVSRDEEAAWIADCSASLHVTCCPPPVDLSGEACSGPEDRYQCVSETDACAGARHRCEGGVWVASCCFCTVHAPGGFADSCHPGTPVD
jgi:hypothetical protein